MQGKGLLDNAKEALRPGQFARVLVHLPEEPSVIALPQTAVVISLYGSYVYQVVPAPPAKDGQAGASGQAAGSGQPAAPTLQAKQIFVQTGRRLGTDIEITKGVEPGMQVVTSGQNKVSNGSPVTVDNSVNPATAPDPLAGSHG